MVASSLDKKIVFWDILNLICVQIITLETVSAHTITYSQDYKVMLSAQYENVINVWSFDNSDCYHTGKLIGHNT
jgi:WD40 repeat protein